MVVRRAANCGPIQQKQQGRGADRSGQLTQPHAQESGEMDCSGNAAGRQVELHETRRGQSGADDDDQQEGPQVAQLLECDPRCNAAHGKRGQQIGYTKAQPRRGFGVERNAVGTRRKLGDQRGNERRGRIPPSAGDQHRNGKAGIWVPRRDRKRVIGKNVADRVERDVQQHEHRRHHERRSAASVAVEPGAACVGRSAGCYLVHGILLATGRHRLLAVVEP